MNSVSPYTMVVRVYVDMKVKLPEIAATTYTISLCYP